MVNRLSLLALALLLLLSACGGPPEVPDPETPRKVIVYEEDISHQLEGNIYPAMHRVEKARLSIGGRAAVVELYIDAGVDQDGEIMWDDGQLETLVVRVGEGGYVLVPRTYIQGQLDCTVIEELDGGGVVVLVEYKASAGYMLWEFRYNDMDDTFIMHTIYTTEGNVSVVG